MQSGTTPIGHFITQRFTLQKVQKIIEGWRVEPKAVIEKLIDHFREMGIYAVPSHQEQLIMSDMLYQLKFSPEINKIVIRAKQEEVKKQRTRHPAD